MIDGEPVRAGLFRAGGRPALLGSRCQHCGAHHFPRHDACPYCSSEEVVPAELSPAGRLWAWTAVTAAPPGYRGSVPFGFGVVELPEGIRVVTRLTEADPTRLQAGRPMVLRIVELHRDDNDQPVTTYAFAPEEGP